MSDETFGPESRKPINPNEFKAPAPESEISDLYATQPKFKGQIPPELAARLNNPQEDEDEWSAVPAFLRRSKLK